MSELANKGIDIGRIMEKAHNFCPHDLSHLNKMRWMAQDFVKNYQIAPTEAAVARVTFCRHNHDSSVVWLVEDDPAEGTLLYTRPVPTDSSAALSDAIDLATAILSLRVKNPHAEDNCGLWTMGFRYAQTTIATMVAAQPAPVSAQVSEREDCPECNGSGKCDDAGEGDMYFNEWDCPSCKSQPATPVAVAPSPAGESLSATSLANFIDNYEWRTDEFCHAPTQQEREMLHDFAVMLHDDATLATRQPEDGAAKAGGLTKTQQDHIQYPREMFSALISGNSPYAFYLFQWVPYQTEAKRWRLKMCHDVRTFDGREAFGIWPNGSSCGPFKDDEVEFIRISKSQHGEEWEDPRPVAAAPSAPQGESK